MFFIIVFRFIVSSYITNILSIIIRLRLYTILIKDYFIRVIVFLIIYNIITFFITRVIPVLLINIFLIIA